MNRELFVKVSTFSGILCPIVSYFCIFLAISKAPWFRWEENALSDLGAHTGSDVIFNGGLIIGGILLLVFAVWLIFYFEDIIAKIGSFILSIDSIALSLIGVFPETFGRIHLYVSIAFFVLFPIAYLIISISLFMYHREKLLGILAVIGAVASIIIWSFPWKSYGITGVAIPEFLSSLFGSLWVMTAAIKIYLKTRK